MSMTASRANAAPDQRVRSAAIAVALAVAAAGVAASLADARLGLLAAAVAIGWTQLVGL